MTSYKHILVLVLSMQVLASCWARSRFVPHLWAAPASYWTDLEGADAHEMSNLHNNINEIDLLDRFLPVVYKGKKPVQQADHAGQEERSKKFLGESASLHDDHNLQGLWAMPGRR